MKYKFKVCKISENEETPKAMISRFSETFDEAVFEETVFESEINADEMVELMQHLWRIATNRKK